MATLREESQACCQAVITELEKLNRAIAVEPTLPLGFVDLMRQLKAKATNEVGLLGRLLQQRPGDNQA